MGGRGRSQSRTGRARAGRRRGRGSGRGTSRRQLQRRRRCAGRAEVGATAAGSAVLPVAGPAAVAVEARPVAATGAVGRSRTATSPSRALECFEQR